MFFFILPISILLIAIIVQYEQSIYKKMGVIGFLRRSFLISLLAHSLIIFLFNEILSLFDGLTIINTRLFWSILVILEIVVLYEFYQTYPLRKGQAVRLIMQFWKNIRYADKWLIYTAILLYIIPLMILSVIVPPNNFDAHSYHLNRIIEWLGNHNINHYPTRHNQQLYHNVFAEYIVMHTFLLSESDVFAGTVQFLASIGSIVACSLVTKRLGGTSSVQILSSVMLVTLPIAILESTSVQVDYVASFFFITFLYFGYEALDYPEGDTIIFMALSLAFGSFSKYTIFMYSLPFCVYFGLRFLQLRGFIGSVKIFGIFAAMLFFVFMPFMFRNYDFFGDVLSPVKETGLEAENLTVKEFSFKNTISGMVKNVGLHIGLPSNSYNLFMESLVEKLHKMLGVNLNPDGADTFLVRFVLHEDMVPNTIHQTILFFSLVGLFFIKGKTRLNYFALCACAGFAIFSSLMIFQLWSSRTQMPFFLMGCIISAVVLDRFLGKWTVYLSFALILFSTVFVLANPSKPLVPLRYYSKKFLSYTPIAVCPQNKRQELTVVRKLTKFYSATLNKNKCFQLQNIIPRKDQDVVFEILDKVGYFDEEKYETVFTSDKTKLYFFNHPNDYEKCRDLIPRMKSVQENIGILFKAGNGYYHYWAMIQGDKYQFGQMKYIGYRPKYSELSNANQKFEYRYIFGDDPGLLKHYYKKNLIDTVYSSKGFYFAKLKWKVADIISL
ncbi:hypothetical protein DYBT9275_00098 [Dyadobacter sp. CECT 9275]|uniref:Glycosyltransferase RgtA/B/C/D-like domain-containing protein n=1 Tax=Dyadobacter helix TaxID=2822344 RepID=A0A916J9C8_9BACT|nr:glycosyltransferase family 39 protein [Dyadobacter sp. CECT 9275]CAG4988514.1 hypothetical protein DYBT9275_00098 [Dyadobacter sp. CECT 9275]